MCPDLFIFDDNIQNHKGGTFYMDDRYRVFYFIRNLVCDSMTTKEKYFDTLTEAETYFSQLKSLSYCYYIAIWWGDSKIKEYRRPMDEENDGK